MATSGQQVLIKRILCFLSKIVDETEDPENTYIVRTNWHEYEWKLKGQSKQI